MLSSFSCPSIIQVRKELVLNQYIQSMSEEIFACFNKMSPEVGKFFFF